MNQLISIRTNLTYGKGKDEKGETVYKRLQEIILLVDKPTYNYSNEGDITRERAIKELRFTVTETAMEELIKTLVKLKEVEPDELT